MAHKMKFPATVRGGIRASVVALVMFGAIFSATEIFADEIKIDPAVAGESKTGREWSDVAAMKKRMAKKILAAFPDSDKGISSKSVDEFLKAPENRMLLARWYFVELAGDKVIAAAVEKSAERRTFLRFLSSPEWLEGYLYSGEPKNADTFLEMMLAILKKYPDAEKDPMLRKIATTTAAEFSRNGWSKDDPARVARRYKFFADSWKGEKLNVLFDDLDYWDMRIVCGWKGNDEYGNEYSLRWSRDNVKLSEKGYASPTEIHQLNYRLFSKLGDSVQTGEYYAPFRKHFSNKRGETNKPAMAFEVGAVCGGVSHFGATGAIANGIPALTMGEPGHCAFAVRVNGQWRANNTLSFRRQAHWRCFGGPEAGSWAFLILMQDMFSDQKNTVPALRKYALAKFFAAQDKRKKAAAELYEFSLAQQPLNYIVWRDYCDYAKEQKAKGGFWMKANEKAVSAFIEKYPDVCARVLERFIYPNLFPLVKDDKTKLEIAEKFFKNLDALGPSSWEMEKFWDAQKKYFGDAGGKYVALGKTMLKDKKEYKTLFDNWAAGNPRKE